MSAAKHYSFQWRKNGRNVEELNGPEIVEEVWLPDKDNKIFKYGLILHLEDIQESANYTCVVKDSRADPLNKEVSSQVEVRVFVSERFPYDVCDQSEKNSLYRWPMTFKGQYAIRSCTDEQEGLVMRKCNPSNVKSRGTWSAWNMTTCIHRTVSSARDDVSSYFYYDYKGNTFLF